MFEVTDKKINEVGAEKLNLNGTTVYIKQKEEEKSKKDRSNDTIVLAFPGSNGSGIDGIELCKGENGEYLYSVASVTFTGSFGTGTGSKFEKVMKMSEASVYKDAERLYDYVTKALDYGKVVIVGYSFSGPVAAHLTKYAEETGNNRIVKLILRSPMNGIEYPTAYYSGSKFLGKVARFATLGNKLDTYSNLKNLKNKELEIKLFCGGEEKDFLNINATKIGENLMKAGFKNISKNMIPNVGHIGYLNIIK